MRNALIKAAVIVMCFAFNVKEDVKRYAKRSRT
jgi:hypothetical protein